MTLTVELPPEAESKLLLQAALAGKQPEDFALEAIEENLSAGVETMPRMSNDEWHRRFDALLASMPSGNLNADLNRESVYEDRGL